MLILFALAFFITVSNVSAASVTPNQVANSSTAVKNYVDNNHKLPNTVNISGNQVNMSNYLGLSTSAILNISKGSNAAITIKNFGAASSPSENITTRTISKAEYLDMANRVRSYMDKNGRAPNYVTQTSTGSTIRYESMIYMFSQVLSYYNTNKVLPNNITVKPWASVISNSDIIGSTSYGYVEKKIYGNKSSNQTIVLIIGVHPDENGIHTAIYNALTSKSSKLTKRYVLYYIHVTQDASDYSKGRMNGQLLAQNFVVPDVPKEHPMLVLDNHENHGANSGYTYYRFLYLISNTTITKTYANKIISQMKLINSNASQLVIYNNPPNPTSPEYVTGPIASKGIPTIIYETYMYDSTTQKATDANTLIDALDSFDKPVDTKSPFVTVNPAGGTFNTPQTITLTTKDPDSSTTTTYYTTDGSDPTTSSTHAIYTVPITLSSSTTLKFAAVDPANHWSPVYTENYVINSTIPIITADIKGGAYKTPQTVTLTTTCPDSTYTTYYTTDGTIPTTASTPYNGSIEINSTTTLISAAINEFGIWGPVFNQTYIIDNSTPTVNASLDNGSFNTSKTVILTAEDADSSTVIYYTTDGSDPKTSSTRVKYTSSIIISSTTTLKFYAVDAAGNPSDVYTKNYTIDKTAPTAWANYKTGTYNTNKTINLMTNEFASIYYTIDGTTPTTASKLGTGSIVITSTTTLKFIAIDKAGNKSPVYTEKYTIDKTAPQLISTNPKSSATGYSRTAAISIKFSENIAAGINWSKVYIKNLRTGQIVGISKSISGNTLTLKMAKTRYAYTWYQVYIPASAVKDIAGNNLAKVYTFKFKTG